MKIIKETFVEPTSKQQLQAINDTILTFQNAGQDLVFSKPEEGLVVRLRKGVVDLVFSDDKQCKVVHLDLSHASNSKLLAELSSGLKEAQSMKSIESPLIRLGLTIQCVSQPFFETMTRARGDTVKIVTSFDGSHQLMHLKAEVSGETDREIKDSAVLKSITKKLGELGVRSSYKFEVQATNISLQGLDEAKKRNYLLWLAQPLPASSSKTHTAYSGLIHNQEVQIEALLTKPREGWKRELLSILKDVDLSAVQIKISGDQAEIESRRILQALIDQLAAAVKG
jgi:hypothetical protein